MSKSLRVSIILAFLSLIIPGCSNNSNGETHHPGSSVDALEARHAARWSAVIRVDFDTVYEYATPEYRKAFSKTHLHNQYAAQLIRRSAEIIDVNIEEDGTTAKVKTRLTFATELPGQTDLYEDQALIKETWRFIDGYWWHVERK